MKRGWRGDGMELSTRGSGGGRGYLLYLVVVGVLSGILAALMYRFVETPAIRLKTPASVVQANVAGSAAREDAHVAAP